MIAGAAKFQRNAADLANHPADVIVEPHLVFGSDEWATFLGREDYVIKQIGIGVRHVLKLTRLSRNVFCMRLSPAPQAHSDWGSDPGAYAPRLYAVAGFAGLRPSATSDRFTD